MSGKIKILFASFEGVPSENAGGPGNILYKIIKGLNRDRFETSFVSYKIFLDSKAITSDQRIAAPLKKRITNYLYYNNRIYRKITTSDSYLANNYRKRDLFFNEFTSNGEWDIIHSHDSLAGYYFKDYPNAKKILTIHSKGSIENDWTDIAENSGFVRGFMNELKRREVQAFNNSDIITFPGEYARELFYEDYKGLLRKDKEIRIVNNGIDTGEINSYNEDTGISPLRRKNKEHDLVLLSVANHVKHKNIFRILEVVKKLKSAGKNPLLINAGAGNLTEEIMRRIKTDNLGENVYLAGNIGNSAVINLMKSADAFVTLADRSIFDLSLLEAAACGLPVVAELTGGNSEILKDYPGCIVVTGEDADGICKKLIETFYGKSRVPEITDYTFRFTIQNMITEYEKIFLELTDAR